MTIKSVEVLEEQSSQNQINRPGAAMDAADAPRGDTHTVSIVTHVARQPSFQLGATLLVVAAALLVASIFLPYWRMRLNAPQYPKGLYVTVYVNHMTGDVREIDGLNHYIGMAPLENAAQLERSLAPIALGVIVLMIVGFAFIHQKWAFILALPALTFPIIFLVDMWVWLWYYGNHLDPTAALSSSIKPFTPTILGTGNVGQFSTTAWLQPGWYMALVAAVLTGIALWLRRRAQLAVEQNPQLASPQVAKV